MTDKRFEKEHNRGHVLQIKYQLRICEENKQLTEFSSSSALYQLNWILSAREININNSLSLIYDLINLFFSKG